MTDSDKAPEQSGPRIYIDEDWKTQAQREKEELARKYEREKRKQTHGETQLPPATFGFLVSTLSAQAMVAMGAFEDPSTGKTGINLAQSKHLIDTIQMLEDKTKGNLTPQENEMLQSMLHELRLGYVQASSAPKQQPSSES